MARTAKKKPDNKDRTQEVRNALASIAIDRTLDPADRIAAAREYLTWKKELG